MKSRLAALCFAFALLAGCASAPARQDRFTELRSLDAELRQGKSATLTLGRWCADHHLADPARVYARRAREAKAIPPELRVRLAVTTDEPIAYRRVQLVCGEHVLSEADNWYVPGRLTPEMNQQLDATDEPFGKVVKPLGFERRPLAVEWLWQTGRAPPHDLLRHTAVLYTATQVPFSVVVETYESGLFDTTR
jgi:hypothetical protein